VRPCVSSATPEKLRSKPSARGGRSPLAPDSWGTSDLDKTAGPASSPESAREACAPARAAAGAWGCAGRVGAGGVGRGPSASELNSKMQNMDIASATRARELRVLELNPSRDPSACARADCCVAFSGPTRRTWGRRS
jgi:hypothetical protein